MIYSLSKKILLLFLLETLAFSLPGCVEAKKRFSGNKNPTQNGSPQPIDPEFANVGGKVAQEFEGLPYTPHQASVELLNDNVESWYARWDMINKAQSTIDIVYFIVDVELFGKAFIGLLIKKAKEGKKVRLLIDTRGSPELTGGHIEILGNTHHHLAALIKAGGTVAIFNPPYKNLGTLFDAVTNVMNGKLDINSLKTLAASNHDKIIIIDKKMTLTGGRNITKDYFSDVSDHPSAYRDTDILIDSPDLAQAMTTAIDEEMSVKDTQIVKPGGILQSEDSTTRMLFYAEAMDQWIKNLPITSADSDGRKEYVSELGQFTKMHSFTSYVPFKSNHSGVVKILDKNSLRGDRNDITNSLVKMINATEKELIIQNPYVMLTDIARKALQDANDRGVKIIVHTNSPASTDDILTQAFFVDEWQDMLKRMRNMEIWAFTGKRNLHSKVFIFDRTVAAIGTYNMDYMSEQINSEVIAAVNSKPFATVVAKSIFDLDLSESRKYEIEILADGSTRVIYGPLDTIQNDKTKQLIIDLVNKHGQFLKPLL